MDNFDTLRFVESLLNASDCKEWRGMAENISQSTVESLSGKGVLSSVQRIIFSSQQTCAKNNGSNFAVILKANLASYI